MDEITKETKRQMNYSHSWARESPTKIKIKVSSDDEESFSVPMVETMATVS